MEEVSFDINQRDAAFETLKSAIRTEATVTIMAEMISDMKAKAEDRDKNEVYNEMIEKIKADGIKLLQAIEKQIEADKKK